MRPGRIALGVIALLMFCQTSFSVPRQIKRHKVCWAMTHPFIARKALRISKKTLYVCHQMALSMKLDGDLNGGTLDAFRHAFWMASLAQKMRPGKALRLGIAHEKDDYSMFVKNMKEDGEFGDSVSTAMDLYNNSVGVSIGAKNKNVDDETLIAAIVASIKEGSMRCIKKNKTGEYLTCDGQPIPADQINHKWSNPKCLVGSK